MVVLRVHFAVAWVACMGLLVPLAPARAQQAPLLQGPGETRPELSEREREAGKPNLPGRILPRIPLPAEDPAATALSGGEIAVAAFRFTGNTQLDDAQLEAITRAYLGPARRYSALLEARDRVTRAYVDAGYISSGAVLPAQDFSDGVVELQIVEGQLTRIEVATDGRLRERYIASRLEAGAGVLNINHLRERLRRLKRDPRVDAVAAELIPGEERGESLLSIVVDESTAYWGTASFDNYTPESVGGLRGRFRAGHRNLTGWGDSLSAGYAVAEGLHDVDVRLAVPLSRYDTTVEIWMRRAWSEIVEDAIADLFDIESRTQAYGLRLQQPVLRRRNQQARVFVAADWKRGRSFLTTPLGNTVGLGDPDNEDSTVAVLRTGADYFLRMQRRAIAARATASFGLDALGATSNAADGFADGQFVSGLVQIQAVEYLPWYGLRLHSRLDAQLADGHLLGLEQFAIGGHASVRGYRENLVVRDLGVVGSLELRIPLPGIDPIESIEFALFSDAGYGRYRGGSASGATVVSAGVGLHANVTRYARLSLEWARDLNNPDAVRENELQDKGLHFSLQLRFP